MSEPAGWSLEELAGATTHLGLGRRELRGDGSVRISGITHDSRNGVAGTLFCCLRGERVDGHAFAADVVAAGAAALLVERPLAVDAPQLVVDDSRLAMPLLAAVFHGEPSRAMTVVGVTGTNGKTTVTYLLAAVFEQAGWATGIIGTLSGSHTTPEAPELQARLAAARDGGKRAVAMEVSSHALAMHRVDGTHFAVAVFTNLGRDHLDFHGTVERYFAAKASLFVPGLTEHGVVNADDLRGQLLLDAATVPMTPFSLEDVADASIHPDHAEFTWRGQPVRLPLGGWFNVANAMAAATTASVLEIDDATIAAGLTAAPAVPGRFEPVDAGQDFAVIVDYAHTPDGLAEALRAARSATSGRVLVVFGCGGDRDPAKRPEMGATAADAADVAVVTSDNPRSEDPAAIISAVLSGVPARAHARVQVEPDRRRAIAIALEEAAPGDVVLVAGKGHETTQTIGDQVIDFDDRTVVRELLRQGGLT